jgi:DnaK suppressor protein
VVSPRAYPPEERSAERKPHHHRRPSGRHPQHPDIADRASEETDRALELRIRDRQRKLVAKIDSALRRIEEGEFGYCRETGEPISLKRLVARPTTTLSLEAQERHERREKVHRDE